MEFAPLPSIVICPPTLIGHWVYEVNKFVDIAHLNPLMYAGPPGERARQSYVPFFVILHGLTEIKCHKLLLKSVLTSSTSTKKSYTPKIYKTNKHKYSKSMITAYLTDYVCSLIFSDLVGCKCMNVMVGTLQNSEEGKEAQFDCGFL